MTGDNRPEGDLKPESAMEESSHDPTDLADTEPFSEHEPVIMDTDDGASEDPAVETTSASGDNEVLTSDADIGTIKMGLMMTAMADVEQDASAMAGCLKGLTFLFEGRHEGLPRKDGEELVKAFEGEVVGHPNQDTYIVSDEVVDPVKVQWIKQHSLKVIYCQGLFDLIHSRSFGMRRARNMIEQLKARQKQSESSTQPIAEEGDVQTGAEEDGAITHQPERRVGLRDSQGRLIWPRAHSVI